MNLSDRLEKVREKFEVRRPILRDDRKIFPITYNAINIGHLEANKIINGEVTDNTLWTFVPNSQCKINYGIANIQQYGNMDALLNDIVICELGTQVEIQIVNAKQHYVPFDPIITKIRHMKLLTIDEPFNPECDIYIDCDAELMVFDDVDGAKKVDRNMIIDVNGVEAIVDGDLMEIGNIADVCAIISQKMNEFCESV